MLLAGPLRWIPTELARRLRRYAAGGGRVASFGTDALRRGVDVARDRLLRPLPPAPEDAFGAQIADARTLGSPQPLEPVADEGDTGLLTGVETLPGFAELEESRSTAVSGWRSPRSTSRRSKRPRSAARSRRRPGPR